MLMGDPTRKHTSKSISNSYVVLKFNSLLEDANIASSYKNELLLCRQYIRYDTKYSLK